MDLGKAKISLETLSEAAAEVEGRAPTPEKESRHASLGDEAEEMTVEEFRQRALDIKKRKLHKQNISSANLFPQKYFMEWAKEKVASHAKQRKAATSKEFVES